MTEVFLDPEADQELARLESDPTAEKLLRRVDDVLDALERDPSDPALRRHRFSNGLWYVLIPYHQGDYALLWEPHGTPWRFGISVPTSDEPGPVRRRR